MTSLVLAPVLAARVSEVVGVDLRDAGLGAGLVPGVLPDVGCEGAALLAGDVAVSPGWAYASRWRSRSSVSDFGKFRARRAQIPRSSFEDASADVPVSGMKATEQST